MSWRCSKENPAIIITLVSNIINRMHANVHQSFMQLWVYHSDFNLSDTEQKVVYSNLSLTMSIANFISIIPLTFVATRSPLKIVLPTNFIICGMSLCLFYIIRSPT